MRNLLHAFKESGFVKRLVYIVVGSMSFPGLAVINKMQINGMDKLKNLPKKNVLFVSNHQTYFAEVIAFLHVFSAVKIGRAHV